MKSSVSISAFCACLAPLLGACAPNASDAASAADTPPNFIFVFPDQMRGSTLGFLGREPVKTPNLDAFSREAVVFTQAASNYPVCSPYRAMLMTGQYATKTGVKTNCHSLSAPYDCQLDVNTVCLTDVLAAHNYATAYIGKWHLDAPHEPFIKTYNNSGKCKWNEFCPKERRHGNAFWYAYGTYDDHLKPMYWATDSARDQWRFVKEYGPKHEVNKAFEFLDSRPKDRPFSMILSMNPPHTGYNAVPREYYDLYKDLDVEALCKQLPGVPPKGTQWGDYFRKNVKWQYAQISAVDHEFGRLMEGLKARGLDKNTIVVFTSDHGDCCGRYGEQAKNNYYEPSINVPFMIRYPGKLQPGTSDMLFSTPDIYPTMLGLMGLQNSIPASVQGINYAQTMRDGTFNGADAQLYMRWTLDDCNEELAVAFKKPSRRGLRTKQYTYVQTENGEVLFDRIQDPYQLKNCATDNPELCKKFAAELEQKWSKIE